jgi:hypothetical protein
MKIGIFICLCIFCTVPASAQFHIFPGIDSAQTTGFAKPMAGPQNLPAHISHDPDFDLKTELCKPDDFLNSPDAANLIGRQEWEEWSQGEDQMIDESAADRGNQQSDQNANHQQSDYDRFHWEKAFTQSLLFLGIMHGFRLAEQPDTRSRLRGPFFKDWFRTVGDLRGWSDGDNYMINYVGHPFQGSINGRIQIQNDPRGSNVEFSSSKDYFKSRLKAFGFSALLSTQFELGPISEASLGNAEPSHYSPHPTSYIDLVITPVLGTAWLVTEDAIDRYLITWIENRFNSRLLLQFARTFLNPSRSFANLLRFKRPWYRETRP